MIRTRTPFFRGGEHLNLLGGNPHILGKPLGTQALNGLGSLLLTAAGQEEKVAFPVSQLRHLTAVDTVGIHNDQTLLCLTEDLRKANGRQGL